MLRNYLTTAVRHLLRHPLYSAINIFGFAIGLACCIVIIAYVRGELSYDRFVPGHERTYRVLALFKNPGATQAPSPSANVMGPAGPALATDIPQLQSVTRIRPETNAVKRGDTLFFEKVMYADSNFFDTIPLELVAGDPATAIAEPNTIVLSQAMAKKYFGEEDPVGQVMTFDGSKPMTVSGVLKDIPANSHLEIGILTSYRSASYNRGLEELETAWYNGNHYIYVRLNPGATPQQVEEQLPAFEARHFPDRETTVGLVKGGDLIDLSLQPFADIHLHSVGFGNMKPPGDIDLVYAFAGIAFLILLIASINFVVLTTARSAERSKEVGLRKVLGSTRRALVFQFLLETMLVTAAAFLIALSLSDLAMPFVSEYLQRPLADGYGVSPAYFAAQLGVVSAVGLCAGLYPAMYLSSLRPAAALKGEMRASRGHFRSVLVVIQFAISIALIIVTTVMFAQTDFARNVRMGFSTDRMIVVGGIWRTAVKPHMESLITRLEAEPAIESVNGSQYAPGDAGFEGRTFSVPGDAEHQSVGIESLSVDYKYLETYQVKLLAGRMFDENRPVDRTRYPVGSGTAPATPGAEGTEPEASAILTRTALTQFGFDSPEAAIGKRLDRLFREDGEVAGVVHYTIVGVVDDFQRRTARSIQNGVVFFVNPDEFGALSIKARPGQSAEAMAAVERAWRELLPEMPVKAYWLDERYQQIYEADAREGTVFASFALLALAIACLGLFGLAAFTVDRRTKEIGIRKVMGASTGKIVRLLVWQFSRPVLIANLIAWPLAWYAATEWLESFSDRIDLTPLYFVAASIAVLAISWLTVSGHALRVARAKPVAALRYE